MATPMNDTATTAHADPGAGATAPDRSAAERIAYLRGQVIGGDLQLATPYGERPLLYADYTASGRGVRFIEAYLTELLADYGNTHTEDDATGARTTARLAAAEHTIKRLLGANDNYKLIAAGSGASGAIQRLQMILGVYVPPALREAVDTAAQQHQIELPYPKSERPVVFVGPFEHHSNEISWRECYVEVVEIELTADGLFDLADLEAKVSDARYRHRRKIGSFSAASNVSGVRAPTREIAAVMHRHGGAAFFDFAALAPYVAIDVAPAGGEHYDGVMFSPHKFLGGPGSPGILLLHQRHYRHDLPPTHGAGGTVEFVNFFDQDYVMDIETREKPGTPPILQTMKAALAMELPAWVGYHEIERRESAMVAQVMQRLAATDSVELIGNADPARRIGIVSFNVRAPAPNGRTGYLHPRFVVTLLNDLFGIQARAGCSCAGPYGHRLLGIDRGTSYAYRELILSGHGGYKPGWARISLHYLMTDAELEYLCAAIELIARSGHLFLAEYQFDLDTGAWQHRQAAAATAATAADAFGLDLALRHGMGQPSPETVGARATTPSADQLQALLAEADAHAARLQRQTAGRQLRVTEREDLIRFVYYEAREAQP